MWANVDECKSPRERPELEGGSQREYLIRSVQQRLHIVPSRGVKLVAIRELHGRYHLLLLTTAGPCALS